MRLTLKQQWRPRPLGSFLGFLDIKTGVTIGLLFALLNKVAGVYGLIAVFTGGSFAQISLYVYSCIALVAFGWGLRAVGEEDPKRTLYFAHIFFADHILSTAWTVFFAVVWWLYTPHDGRRQANSAAQEELLKGGVGQNMTDAERTQAALMIWNKEKGLAAAVIVAGWLLKIYFSVLIYSYAIHLRKGSYRSLPHTLNSSTSQYVPLSGINRHYPDTSLGEDDDEVEDFYRMPGRSPQTGSSVASFADFVSAPGRGRRLRADEAGRGITPKAYKNGSAFPANAEEDMEEEVLFDSDELAGSHSKLGTEESTSVSSRDEDGNFTQQEGSAWRQNYSRDRHKSVDKP